MIEKDIIKMLNKNYSFQDKRTIDELETNELKEVFKYLKFKLKVSSNWNKNKYLEFVNKYKLNHKTLHSNLKKFSNRYGKKIKKQKTFENYLEKINYPNIPFPYHNIDSRFKLKEKANIEDFLKTIHLLKSHLHITDRELIYLINDSINTDLSFQTLLNYYYKYKEKQ